MTGTQQHQKEIGNSRPIRAFFARSEGYRQGFEATHNPKVAGSTLGWTPEVFGDFDNEMSRRDRGCDVRKAERVGKKYQWIALHELLARASDNFEFRVDSLSTGKGRYEGIVWTSERKGSSVVESIMATGLDV